MQETTILDQERIKVILNKTKPHLIEIEKQLQDSMKMTGYGSLTIEIDFRSSVVNKMKFIKGATWLKDNTKT